MLLGLNSLCWILSVVTLASCRYVYYEDSSSASGLFTVLNGDGECQRYSPATEFEAGHVAARAFSVIANLCLVAAWVGIALVLFLLPNGKPTRILWLVTRILYVVALISVLLTNTIFGGIDECTDSDSTVDCRFGPTASINSINAIFLIVIVSTCWCTPIPPSPVFKCICTATGGGEGGGAASVPSAAPTEIVRNIEATPRGRKITEVATFPDGTRRVATRFEESEGAILPDVDDDDDDDDYDEESQPPTSNNAIPSGDFMPPPLEEEVSAYTSEDDWSSGRHYLPQQPLHQGGGGIHGPRAEP